MGTYIKEGELVQSAYNQFPNSTIILYHTFQAMSSINDIFIDINLYFVL